MASISRLKRRAWAWQRYERKVYGPGALAVGRGAARANMRMWVERDRRHGGLDYACPCGSDCWDEPIPYRPFFTVPLLELL